METLWPEFEQASVLPPDDVRVFAVPLHDIRASDESLLAILSPDERRRAAKFRIEKPRRQFVVGRAALRNLLGAQLNTPAGEVAIVCDASGKPRIEGAGNSAPLRFNVAHSDDIVLVAIALGCEVGVDVERLRVVNHKEQIARRYFHTAELEAILAAPAAQRDAAFLRCWTGKEAVVKAVGTGLSDLLSAFQVPADDHNDAWVDLPAAVARRAARCWLQSLRPDSDYVGAVACVGARRAASCLTIRV